MDYRNDPLLDAFLFEAKQIMEKAELILLESEKTKSLDTEAINEIFRIMHTIKGSSAMMEFQGISDTAHAVEDLFFYIREKRPVLNFNKIADIILFVIDFIKNAIRRIENGEELDEQCDEIKATIHDYLNELKSGRTPEASKGSAEETSLPGQSSQEFSDAEQLSEANLIVWIKFDDDCGMESIRAFTSKRQLEEIATVLGTNPSNLENFEEASSFINKNGFELYLSTEMESSDMEKFVRDHTVYLKDCMVNALAKKAELMEETASEAAPETAREAAPESVPETRQAQATRKVPAEATEKATENVPPTVADTAVSKAGSPPNASSARSEPGEKAQSKAPAKQSYISVNVAKLDKLMDIVGELVISEMMVTRNPEITRLKIKAFMNASNQLKKVTTELQDIVMSIRMVPIGATFYSMQRIVRDMCKKLGKNVDLIISGEETEVDKNIIELISDPLMHLIRNSIDHGIEDPETRSRLGKPTTGRIFLDARNEGGDVWVTVKDDGKGLNREAILNKARDGGLLTKEEKELTDKEIWNFILMPGFSTKKAVSEYSGRGVGMDVVMKNVEKIGGRLNIDSSAGKGTTFAIKIPLTLAIIEGMEIAVGKCRYTIPITLVKEAIRPKGLSVVTDTAGHEAVMLRGECVEIMRLHREFRTATKITDLEEGILIIVQNDTHTYGIFADRLIGEHQVVVKPVPKYMGKIEGVSGCSVLGDGNISLILDVAGLMERRNKIQIRRDEDE